MEKSQEYLRLRNEHSRRTKSGYYAEHLGEVCMNCGATDKVTYHHIVPLTVGGTNNLGNIVCVCVRCHKAIHGHMSHEMYNTNYATGRPSTASEDRWDEVLSEYAQCKISASEVYKRLKRSKGSHLADSRQYKDFCKAHGIAKIKNNLDIIAKNGKGTPDVGDCVGYMVLENGITIENMWE